MWSGRRYRIQTRPGSVFHPAERLFFRDGIWHDGEIRSGSGDFIGMNDPHVLHVDFRCAVPGIAVRIQHEFELTEQIGTVTELEIGVQSENVRFEFIIPDLDRGAFGAFPFLSLSVQESDAYKCVAVGFFPRRRNTSFCWAAAFSLKLASAIA